MFHCEQVTYIIRFENLNGKCSHHFSVTFELKALVKWPFWHLKLFYLLFSVYVTPTAVTCLPVQLSISEHHVLNTQVAQFTLPMSAQISATRLPLINSLGTSTVCILVLVTWQLHLPSICLSLLLSLTSLRCFLRDERSSAWAVLIQSETVNIWLEVRCNLVHRRQKVYFYLKCQLSCSNYFCCFTEYTINSNR